MMERSGEKGARAQCRVAASGTGAITVTGCCPETLISLRAKERARGGWGACQEQPRLRLWGAGVSRVLALRLERAEGRP